LLVARIAADTATGDVEILRSVRVAAQSLALLDGAAHETLAGVGDWVARLLGALARSFAECAAGVVGLHQWLPLLTQLPKLHAWIQPHVLRLHGAAADWLRRTCGSIAGAEAVLSSFDEEGEFVPSPRVSVVLDTIQVLCVLGCVERTLVDRATLQDALDPQQHYSVAPGAFIAEAMSLLGPCCSLSAAVTLSDGLERASLLGPVDVDGVVEPELLVHRSLVQCMDVTTRVIGRSGPGPWPQPQILLDTAAQVADVLPTASHPSTSFAAMGPLAHVLATCFLEITVDAASRSLESVLATAWRLNAAAPHDSLTLTEWFAFLVLAATRDASVAVRVLHARHAAHQFPFEASVTASVFWDGIAHPFVVVAAVVRGDVVLCGTDGKDFTG
jgi:hypothetical protein